MKTIMKKKMVLKCYNKKKVTICLDRFEAQFKNVKSWCETIYFKLF